VNLLLVCKQSGGVNDNWLEKGWGLHLLLALTRAASTKSENASEDETRDGPEMTIATPAYSPVL
jgi:hypothetical protein